MGVKGAAASFETWHGEQSLETWCKGVPAKALKKMLAKPTSTTWQDVHRELAQFGLELRDSGGRGMRVFSLDASGDGQQAKKEISVGASKAFRFLKRQELEKRFGAFVPSTKDFFEPKESQTYKRDPVKRLDRKLERKALRDALHVQFLEEQKIARIKYTVAKRELDIAFRADDTARRDFIEQRYTRDRAAIKSKIGITPAQKKQEFVIAKLTVMHSRQQLTEQLANEKAQRKLLLPPLLPWRVWVEERALTGDEAAISALRGMVYQEKRDGKLPAQDPAEEVLENAIKPAVITITDPLVRKLSSLVWKVHKNGTVAYNFKSGDNGFFDAGETYLWSRTCDR
ncbi:hypothetical protein ACFQAT_28525 [Undibacterium arcticum]|uniref:hypothetical protein n=1 Tax=Undibacterium arcticum TaxID=1762892 RepID=UPI0036072E2A